MYYRLPTTSLIKPYRVVSQEVSRRPGIEKTKIPSQTIPCGICGALSDIRSVCVYVFFPTYFGIALRESFHK